MFGLARVAYGGAGDSGSTSPLPGNAAHRAGTVKVDLLLAEEHAAVLLECAMEIRSGFCAPDLLEDDGFLEAEPSMAHIKEWRETFHRNLGRLAARPTAGSSAPGHGASGRPSRRCTFPRDGRARAGNAVPLAA